MQTLLLPAGRSGISPTAAAASHLRRAPSLNIGTNVSFLSSNSLPSLKTLQSSSLANRGSKHCFPILASSQIPPTFTSQNDESEKAKLAQVLKIFLSLSLFFLFFIVDWFVCLEIGKLCSLSSLNAQLWVLSLFDLMKWFVLHYIYRPKSQMEGGILIDYKLMS